MMHTYKNFTTWLKKCRKRLAKRKAVINSAIIVMATISLTVSGAAQSQKSDEETNLIFQVTNVAVSYGSYAANTAEIILDRSVAAGCSANAKANPVITGACGSNNVLLQGAASQRDGLRDNNTRWVNVTTDAYKKFNADVPSLNQKITATETSGLLLLVLAIVVNAL